MDLKLYESTYRVEDAHWWFSGRRAIVFDELRRVMNGSVVRPRILDLGCGTGRNLLELQDLGEPVGVDFQAYALEFCRQRGLRSVAQADAQALPFQDNCFECVVALDLLEHLDDDLTGAREVLRVLQPGGHFIVFSPAYRWLWGPQDDVSHHRRRYTPRSLAGVLRRAGFRVGRLTHANLLLLPLILSGRACLRAMGKRVGTENDLHPGWANSLLRTVFASERYLLRMTDLPMGVSLLCVATKERTVGPAQKTSARG